MDRSGPAESGAERDPVHDVRPSVERQRLSPLELIVVLVRVGVVLVVWLAVFLFAFLGYLTLPAVVLLAFLVVYGALDVYRVRARRAAAARRAPVMDDSDRTNTDHELPS